MQNFQFSNFVPREGFEEEVNRTLGQVTRRLRNTGKVRALGIGFQSGFMFSVVAQVDKKIFSSEIYIKKSDGVGKSRLWLVPKVQLMMRDFENQVHRWKLQERKSKSEKLNVESK